MSAPKNNGGPAFPFRDEGCDGTFDQFTGMTLRDYFAGQAMNGIIAESNPSNASDWIGGKAYAIADAMIRARDKEDGK